MVSVNHFHLKRKAHGLSRRGSDQTWNPFRHISWDREPGRRETWDGGNLEAQREIPDDDEPEQSRIHPVRSEPGVRSGASFPAPDTVLAGSLAKETDVSSDLPITQQRSTSPEDSTELAFDSQNSTQARGVDSRSKDRDSVLRNRKQEPVSDYQGNGALSQGDDEDKKKKKVKTGGLIRHVQPKTPFTFANQVQRTFLNSWINILLLAAPVGIALNYVPSVNRIAVFVVNFIAIVPLAAMLGFATEEIALRTGETLGGLLNATFG
jgi:Ca2+:H+ antiporter